MTDQPAFQDQMPFNHCWGCGADNPDGFQLKSFWSGERAVAEWMPRPEHMAGPEHVLNGGVIATLLDCHAVCTAVADHYRREGRAIGEGEVVWCVTGRLDVTFLKPTPIDAPVHLTAAIAERDGRKSWVEVTLSSQEIPRATARVLAIRVPETWMMEDDRRPTTNNRHQR